MGMTSRTNKQTARLRGIRERVFFHMKPHVRSQFSSNRWPYTYANDFVRAHEEVIPDSIWDQMEISGGVTRAQASQARTHWANLLHVSDYDVAELLACGYIIENGIGLNSPEAREKVPTWVHIYDSSPPEVTS